MNYPPEAVELLARALAFPQASGGVTALLDRIAPMLAHEDAMQYLSDTGQMMDRIAALEAQVKAADELAEATALYSCEDGCNGCPEHERDRVNCGWTAHTARAAYRATREANHE